MLDSHRDFRGSLLEHPTVWEIQSEVEKLHRSLPALLGVLFLTNEGGALGCSMPESAEDAGKIVDQASVAVNFSRLLSEGFLCGVMQEATLRGNTGDLFLYTVAESGVLAFFGSTDSEASAVHFEGRWAAQKLAEIIARNKRLFGP